MTDRTMKRILAMLSKMAYEDPNNFIEYLYHSGMDVDDMRDLEYLVSIARRAPGYKKSKDQLKINGLF
ncbi:MAG: hypothetical protein V3W04_06625 [Gammaproteobacteria bacterium]